MQTGHAAAAPLKPWLLLLCASYVCAQVAGLDVGWHTLLDLKENPKTHRLEVTREVLPGTYPFKFIVDGRWVANYDYPTYQVRASSVALHDKPPGTRCAGRIVHGHGLERLARRLIVSAACLLVLDV